MALVVVMVVTPCVMNALQFWLVDNFIKKHDEPGPVHNQETLLEEVGSETVLRELSPDGPKLLAHIGGGPNKVVELLAHAAGNAEEGAQTALLGRENEFNARKAQGCDLAP